jgi:hypothetical protein
LFEFNCLIIAAGIESRWKASTQALVRPLAPVLPSKLGRTPIMDTTLEPSAYLPFTEGYTLRFTVRSLTFCLSLLLMLISGREKGRGGGGRGRGRGKVQIG